MARSSADKDSLYASLEERVLRGPAQTDAGWRQAAAVETRAGELPAALAAFVLKVHAHAYRIADEDVAALRAAGHSEDAIFDLVAAAAVGAGRVRLDAAKAAIAAALADAEVSRAAR